MTLITDSPGFCGFGDTASAGSGSLNLVITSGGSGSGSFEFSPEGDKVAAA
jgi:hypothetical protein